MPQTDTNHQYNALKTELEICRIGGLFLVIYDNENVPDAVISQLREDMPEYFHFPLHITDKKTVFPIFFSQTFEQVGKQSNIFHVLGIEALSEKDQNEFIQSLQYGRERFKAMPYSIVFWIHPGFVKKLFHEAPDFHHWVFSTYDFTNSVGWVEQSATHHHEKETLFLNNIDGYLRKLIWQYKRWKKIKRSNRNFLLEVMGRANLCECYIDLSCTNHNGKVQPLKRLLDNFLNDNTSFLTMLGDFGTGKTSFSLHYFILHAKRYLKGKSRRIPLFISLKDYPKKLNIQEFIQKEFSEKFKLSFSLAVFQDLILQGRFLFFVDGFDEMVSMSDQEETIENFKELTRLSFEQVQFMTQAETKKKNKIFMTCRTHYFFTTSQEKNFLKADYTVLYRNYATKSQYQITRINVKEFNPSQIKAYIRKNTENEASAQEFLKVINDTYNLNELSKLPLLLNMIVKTMPELRGKQQINAADLYREYTNQWIKRDDWRSQMTPQGKRQFMWELAAKMYQKGGDFSLHYSLLDKPDKSFCKFGCIEENQNGDFFTYETTTCSFLNRDSEGNYKFIHKSFMEYFLSESLFDAIKNKKPRPVKYSPTIDRADYFLKIFIFSYKDWLNGLDLSGLNLNRIDLRDANLKGTNFKDANFNGTLIEDAQFDWEYSFTNTVGMKFVYIPPGEFMMGSPETEPERGSNEIQHKVRLTGGFYMQTTQVTQGQWKAIMGKYNNPSFFKDGGDVCPVEQVSWDDVQVFIKKLNQMEKTDKYRLPTEAEWEYACRAGTTTPFFFGEFLSTEQANYNNNYPLEVCPEGIYRKKTVPVARFASNLWGLYDMHGNVREWCQDWYGSYSISADVNPTGADKGSNRVLRGGSWNGNARDCRSACRGGNSPDFRISRVGFRLCVKIN